MATPIQSHQKEQTSGRPSLGEPVWLLLTKQYFLDIHS